MMAIPIVVQDRAARLPRRQFDLRFLLLLTAVIAAVLAAAQLLGWSWMALSSGAYLVASVTVVYFSQYRGACLLRCAGGYVIVAVLVAMFMPVGVNSAGRGRRSDCSTNLRQVALAMLMYAHENADQLPPAYTVDEQGNRLHSWRSLILPYLEHSNIYDFIRFDEPWDSEYNSQFHNYGVPIFDCPRDGNRLSAEYVVVVGPETFFPGSSSVHLCGNAVPDGATNTILVAEIANSDIHWMEPRDLELSQMTMTINPKLGQGISGNHQGGANVAFGDAHVVHLPDTTPPKHLRAYLTISGGDAPLAP